MSSPNSSSPISIGWPSTSPSTSTSTSSSIASTGSSIFGASWNMNSSSSNILTCAYPSWPSRNSLSPDLKAKDAPSGCSTASSKNNNVPSSYISDFDLLEDLDDDFTSLPILQEAPATPRDLPLPPVMAMPLQPLYAPDRPRKQRRRSSKKTVKITKPMTPIAECPVAAQ